MTFERPQWPNDARCVVTLTFDNFGESFDLLRYGHAGGANADGVYAPRRGIERVLDLLERHGIQEDEAFALLTRLSQHRNEKLRDVAETIVARRLIPEDPLDS